MFSKHLEMAWRVSWDLVQTSIFRWFPVTPTYSHLDVISPLAGHTKFTHQEFLAFYSDDGKCACGKWWDSSELWCLLPLHQCSCTWGSLFICERLREDKTLGERTTLSPEQIADLLEMCLKSTYFSFGGTFMSRRKGWRWVPWSPLWWPTSTWSSLRSWYWRWHRPDPDCWWYFLHPQEGLNRGTPLPSQWGQADHQVHFGAGRFSFLDTLLRRRGDGSLAVSQAEQLSCELHLQCLCPAHTGNSRHKQRYVFVCLFVL